MKILAIHNGPEELAVLKEYVTRGIETYTLFDDKLFKIIFDAETATHAKVQVGHEYIKDFETFFKSTITEDSPLTKIMARLKEAIERIDSIEDYLEKPTFKSRRVQK